MTGLDALVFSSVWVAAAALALCLACGVAMGGVPDAAVLGVAFCGTLVVYNVDRLRDLPRDRQTSPARSEFVERHRPGLLALSVVSAGLSALLAPAVGVRGAALLVAVGLLGLLHRRLKRFAAWKPFYVSAAWTAVGVGLPALRLPDPRHVAWVAALVFASVTANVIASNLRDGEALTQRLGSRVPLRLARGCALASLTIGALAPPAVRPLCAIPAATLLALLFFRPDERYGLVVVDGALLAGSGLALALA